MNSGYAAENLKIENQEQKSKFKELEFLKTFRKENDQKREIKTITKKKDKPNHAIVRRQEASMQNKLKMQRIAQTDNFFPNSKRCTGTLNIKGRSL